MHHHVYPGQPRRQRGIPDVGDPPGHPGHVTAVIVDRDYPADERRAREPERERLADPAGRTSDRHHRRRLRGATLTANAALMANLPSAVSQNRLLPNSVLMYDPSILPDPYPLRGPIMADRPPFGFGPPSRPGDDEPNPGGQGPSGPFGFGPPGGPGGPGGSGDPNQFADALRQFADLLSYTGGPVNWDLAKNLARHAIAGRGDPSVLANERAAVTEAVRLADLWLDDVTAFPSGIRKIEAWSQSEWLEATFPVWSTLCEPIATRAIEAMGSMAAFDPAQLDDESVPPEMRAMLSGMGGMTAFAPMLRQLGGAMLGGQVGTAIGELASEMATSTDIGLPLAPEGTAALLPSGVAAFGDGLSVDPGEVRLFLALREAAHHRLFGHVPWLRQQLLGAVEAYAAGITIDMSKLRDALPEMDMSNPEEALRGALSGETLFRPEDSPQQKAALARLETALALVEGWVATVVSAAADSRLVHSAALAEAIRRRRASGGPSERTFAALVGLELRPRMLREAAALWSDLTDARGTDARDALWAHPDLLPTADDLANPDGFLRGANELDISDFEDGADGAAEDSGTAEDGSTAEDSGTAKDDGPAGQGDAGAE
jgi:putative hydrolase